MKTIIATEDELKQILIGCIKEAFPALNTSILPPAEEGYIKSIQDIADLFACSTVTAQRIKNQIPKSMYFQCGRTFSISKNYLLQEFAKQNKSRRRAK
jgi:hypothetical protein